MKYGLLYYKDTNNIGDDIQTYAAARFLPRIDYMIDRERLNDFVPDKKEYVRTIMNAWYIHDKFNFGFSPYIVPLFVSVFFKKFPYESGVTVGTDYINSDVINVLKRFSPVGTRDKHTLKIMRDLSIDSYFSGCMTLTIERFNDVKKGDYIVTVGLTTKEISYIKSKTKRKVIEFKQDVERGSFSDESWEQRKERVESVLKMYQGAHMVITNKLHCTLPCLALQTPVLLLYDVSFKENKDRIGTYLPYVNYINRKKLFDLELDFENPKSNPDKYLELRENLINTCQEFIKCDVKYDLKLLPDVNIYKNIIAGEKARKDVMMKHFNLLARKYEKECEKSGELYNQNRTLNCQNAELAKELNLIKNSRGWRFLEKIRKIIR